QVDRQRAAYLAVRWHLPKVAPYAGGVSSLRPPESDPAAKPRTHDQRPDLPAETVLVKAGPGDARYAQTLSRRSATFQQRSLSSWPWPSSGPAGSPTPSATAASTLTCCAAAWASSVSACPCPAAAKPSGTPTAPPAWRPRSCATACSSATCPRSKA